MPRARLTTLTRTVARTLTLTRKLILTQVLGCPGLGCLLTTQPMVSPRGGSTYTIPLDARRAATARDTICSEVYRCIFDAVALACRQPHPHREHH